MTGEEIEMKCSHCEHIRAIGVYGWSKRILVCDHKPYKGKWVAEIEKCPKEEKE